MEITPHKKFPGIFLFKNNLATKNLVPGKRVYEEQLFKHNGIEYREWISFRSKPAAAIKKGLNQFPLLEKMKVLYLGLASSTTASHFSDIVGKDGLIYGIEISERVLRDTLPVAKERENLVPLLANGRNPESYSWIEEVDLVYADIAIPDMTEVFIRNCEFFLKPKGFAMIAIKSRSIDVTQKPQIIYKNERKKLENKFNVVDFVTLEPLERDHGFFVCKAKS
ncbi:MAG: fibrillarin-like rRNA/tRNA 2'-O-methyltransferase [Candidatus Aenigmarchaeota archaeon]|nr:fibrillarin-like rRNA/tRNA 2'-O-methyltransferase [Candidatus Aenigmarchaeota archaeon]